MHFQFGFFLHQAWSLFRMARNCQIQGLYRVIYWGYIGIMENKMETSIMGCIVEGLGFRGHRGLYGKSIASNGGG